VILGLRIMKQKGVVFGLHYKIIFSKMLGFSFNR